MGLMERILCKVLGYASLGYLIDDICLKGLCHVIFIILLFEKWRILQNEFITCQTGSTPPTPPRAEPLVTHNDFQQGRVRFYFKPLNINMQFHFHLKKIHLIHTAHPSQLTNPPA